MKKIKVDEEKCIGCGACVAIDSEHFDFNENGLSNVINNDNLESANLQSAIESCPTGAISITECELDSDEVKKCVSEENVNNEKCNCGCEDCTGDENCECGCENCDCK